MRARMERLIRAHATFGVLSLSVYLDSECCAAIPLAALRAYACIKSARRRAGSHDVPARHVTAKIRGDEGQTLTPKSL